MAGRVWPQHYFSLHQNASMLDHPTTIPTYQMPVRFNPMIGIVIAMLFVCCFLLGWLTFYLRACLNARQRRRSGAAIPAVFLASGPAPRQQDRGLDPDSILALPIVQFSSSLKEEQRQQEGQEPVVECSVCLTEFQDKEILKLLPACGHVFHVSCIDMWLCSHSTCPLCRSILVPLKFPCCCNNQAEPGSTNGPQDQVSIIVSSGDRQDEENQASGPTGELDSPSKSSGGLYRSQSTPVPPHLLLQVNQNQGDSAEPGGCLSRTRSWAIL